jgi:hypothetical protein
MSPQCNHVFCCNFLVVVGALLLHLRAGLVVQSCQCSQPSLVCTLMSFLRLLLPLSTILFTSLFLGLPVPCFPSFLPLALILEMYSIYKDRSDSFVRVGCLFRGNYCQHYKCDKYLAVIYGTLAGLFPNDGASKGRNWFQMVVSVLNIVGKNIGDKS